MRGTIGLGVIGLVGIFACGSSGDETAANINHAPTEAPQVGTSENPTEPPTTPPAATTPPAPPEDPTPPPGPVARGISITDLAVFQAVKVPIMTSGAMVKDSQRNAPVVAKRPGILRVYVSPGQTWKPQAVTAELRLVSGTTKFPVIKETKMITTVSKDEDTTTTFNLEVPADSLPAGVTFEVSLSTPDGDDPAKAGSSDARFPKDGTTTDLGADTSGKVRVVIVPVQYNADGSGRTPDVTAAVLAKYTQGMMRVYPTSDVEVTAHAPYPTDTQISANGSGFAQMLREMTDLRQKDGVEKDVYYYGMFMPKASWSMYCSGGCVTGLSGVVDDPNTAAMRASVGIGYGDQESANTMAHEVGHAHGRNHAPCGGAAGPDPRFPYQGGGIGTWGYDIFAKTLISPQKGKDMMGYCPNTWWISDYTYNALFKRIATISTEKDFASRPDVSHAPQRAASYRVATVGEGGEMTWNGDVDLNDANDLQGTATLQAKYLAESGDQMFARDAKFVPFDHLPGGFVFVPKEHAIDATNWKAVSVEGFAHALQR